MREHVDGCYFVLFITFRFGHTWISRDMSLFNDDLRPTNVRFETDDTYNDPALTYITGAASGMEELAYWLSGHNSPETDRIIEEQARSRLFIDRDNNVAFDLAALNIQRGRDHGLKSYTEFRAHCDLSSVAIWTDLIDHDADTITRLQNAGYRFDILFSSQAYLDQQVLCKSWPSNDTFSEYLTREQ